MISDIPFIHMRPAEDVAWMGDGACVGQDLETFYPARGTYTDRGKKICRDCPVRVQCMDYALRHREWGVWGGTDDADRDTFRRKLRSRKKRAS